MGTRVLIKTQAKTNFKENYGTSIGAYILFALLAGAAAGITMGIGGLLIVPPLMVGYNFFCLKIYKGQPADIGEFLSVGFKNYGKNLGGMLWMQLFVFLWSLLLIIPGIIKAIAYSMTPYILTDCPNVSATEALKVSMVMTDGYKGEIFVMGLSFIGWVILSGLTFGILQLLYVGPYMSTSFAGLYENLKQNAIAKGTLRPDMFVQA